MTFVLSNNVLKSNTHVCDDPVIHGFVSLVAQLDFITFISITLWGFVGNISFRNLCKNKSQKFRSGLSGGLKFLHIFWKMLSRRPRLLFFLHAAFFFSLWCNWRTVFHACAQWVWDTAKNLLWVAVTLFFFGKKKDNNFGSLFSCQTVVICHCTWLTHNRNTAFRFLVTSNRISKN